MGGRTTDAMGSGPRTADRKDGCVARPGAVGNSIWIKMTCRDGSLGSRAGGQTDERWRRTTTFRLINSALRKIAVRYVCPLQMLSRFRGHAALHDRLVDVTSNQYSYTGHSRTMHMRASIHPKYFLFLKRQAPFVIGS